MWGRELGGYTQISMYKVLRAENRGGNKWKKWMKKCKMKRKKKDYMNRSREERNISPMNTNYYRGIIKRPFVRSLNRFIIFDTRIQNHHKYLGEKNKKTMKQSKKAKTS